MLVPNLEWTPNRFGDPQIGILTGINSGIPEPVRGLPFLCFFQSRTWSAISQCNPQRHGAPLITKNLDNQHTAPAYWELGEQEKGRLLLTSQTEGVVQPEAQPHLIQTTTQQQLQLSPFSITIPNLTPHSINHDEPQGIKQGEETQECHCQ